MGLLLVWTGSILMPTQPASQPSVYRVPPLNELIAVGAIVALFAWGWLVWSGYGQTPLPLGTLDPERFLGRSGLRLAELPLVLMLVCGGMPLVWGLIRKLLAGTFGSDLLAGLSIITSILLGEYLAGVLVVLMLSGGERLSRGP